MGREATKVVDWSKPQALSTLDVAFPAQVVGNLLPLRADIPEEFWRSSNPWARLASSLFFSGGQLPAPKEGINAKDANRHVQAVLGSFEPKHEHKEAGAAYLMSLWYQEPKSWAEKNKKK